jgi:DNA-binding response OmpR family regulator
MQSCDVPGGTASVIQTGDLIVDLGTKKVEVNGLRVHLTGKEYQILELLSLRKGTTLSKETFLSIISTATGMSRMQRLSMSSFVNSARSLRVPQVAMNS